MDASPVDAPLPADERASAEASLPADERRGFIVGALRAAGSDGVSGEALAHRLGVSRAAVAKHVAALRELGYAIDSAPGSGYVLIAAPDLPLPLEVQPLLDGIPCRLHGGHVTGSTNEDAKALAREGAPEGTVVLASKQTAGKGRLGRVWESPDGGLYLSMVLRPDATPAQISPLGLVIGIGMLRGLTTLGASGLKLKWPNDVLIGTGKLSGTLLEMSAQPEHVDFVVAGMGTNVHRRGDALPAGAYLDDVMETTLPRVAAAEIRGIWEAYRAWADNGFEFGIFTDEYNRELSLVGSRVCVRRMDGSVIAEGTASGVDDFGRLLVGGVPVVAGEVTLRG